MGCSDPVGDLGVGGMVWIEGCLAGKSSALKMGSYCAAFHGPSVHLRKAIASSKERGSVHICNTTASKHTLEKQKVITDTGVQADRSIQARRKA